MAGGRSNDGDAIACDRDPRRGAAKILDAVVDDGGTCAMEAATRTAMEKGGGGSLRQRRRRRCGEGYGATMSCATEAAAEGETGGGAARMVEAETHMRRRCVLRRWRPVRYGASEVADNGGANEVRS
ncbi:hypothetical protein GUJ93_ZPchr0013g36827 [Zizania palustris]|uniref:Uncharacterized protein n=1 Tax=Zizania palustris TaxID=103762 RepID=A0A8J6BU82_ZIZPA|nr:hypothetical protein GUJ93_ZPchr0013g36827 [Zizania palustris]